MGGFSLFSQFCFCFSVPLPVSRFFSVTFGMSRCFIRFFKRFPVSLPVEAEPFPPSPSVRSLHVVAQVRFSLSRGCFFFARLAPEMQLDFREAGAVAKPRFAGGGIGDVFHRPRRTPPAATPWPPTDICPHGAKAQCLLRLLIWQLRDIFVVATTWMKTSEGRRRPKERVPR